MDLVTGGTGLLGSHLLFDLVNSGKKVRALVRDETKLEGVKNTFSYYTSEYENLFREIEWVKGDVTDIHSLLDAMEGVEHVCHCAAIVSFSGKNTAEIEKINVEGTANVVNAGLEKGIRKLCHVSSIAALGKINDKKTTEETPRKTNNKKVSTYSLSKYGAEREAWRGIAEGLDVVIVNPSIIIGPGNWSKGSSNMFSGAYKGIKYYTEGVSGFVDVRDVSDAMIKLMNSEIKNERFILSGEDCSYRQFFNMIHNNFQKPAPYIKAGKLLSDFAWISAKLASCITGTNPLITKETARAVHDRHFFSNEKIKSAIGFDFIPLERSVKDTCELFLKDQEKKKSVIS